MRVVNLTAFVNKHQLFKHVLHFPNCQLETLIETPTEEMSVSVIAWNLFSPQSRCLHLRVPLSVSLVFCKTKVRKES